MNMTLSQAGIDLVKSFEGLRLKAYPDLAGVWTIGYGHTGKEVHAGMEVTLQDAMTILLADLHAAIAVVNQHVRVPVTQNQFDALVVFAYNVGGGAFVLSHLLKYLNAGDAHAASGQFEAWDHVGGKVIPGLLRRRLAERDLFLRAA